MTGVITAHAQKKSAEIQLYLERAYRTRAPPKHADTLTGLVQVKHCVCMGNVLQL